MAQTTSAENRPNIGFVVLIAYGIYAFFALILIFFVITFVKENKGVELEDM